MRPVGFSTGALAKGDFRHGITVQENVESINAVELSALREHELEELVGAIDGLDLSAFQYISFHAPSKLIGLREEAVVELLLQIPESWPIIVHPEIIATPALWRTFGPRLCLENMDNRKSGGRTVDELRGWFATFPDATFCLDVGHAKQIDPTMTLAILMLLEFGDRLKQLHVSDVGAAGEHCAVGVMAQVAFGRLATHVPPSCPLIIESIVDSDRPNLEKELGSVLEAFSAQVSFAMLESP